VRSLLLLTVLLGAACQADEQAIAPEPTPQGAVANEAVVKPAVLAERPMSVISDGRTDGHAAFYFLFPIVPDRAPRTGTFDRDAEPAVTVCRIQKGACAEVVAEFPFRSGPGLGLRTVREWSTFEFFLATWQAPRVSSSQLYRATVRAGGFVLGYADIQVVKGLFDLLKVPKNVVGIVGGWPLPISFRIEESGDGSTGSVGPTGGEVELAGGQVKLTLPAGAVSGPTQVTVTPAAGLPAGGPAVVPGTAWDFGPDGQTFSQPVTMTIRYDPAQLPAGVAESELRIHKLVGTTYRQQNAGLVDLVNKTVSAKVNGFSVYVVMPRQPGQEDVTAPVITGVQVLDPVTGTWGQAATFDVNNADASVRIRIAAEDDVSGVQQVAVYFVSPSRARTRGCGTAQQVGGVLVMNPPVSGSDTHGIWECEFSLPRYSEPGPWRISDVIVGDGGAAVGSGLGNVGRYALDHDTGQVCGRSGVTGCLAQLPTLAVVADPWDGSGPLATGDPEVSLDVEPRSFGPNIVLDVTGGPASFVFRVPFSDDLAGLAPEGVSAVFGRIGGAPLERIFLQSSSQILCSVEGNGPLLSGTVVCRAVVPQSTLPGTYVLRALSFSDRIGNSTSYTMDALSSPIPPAAQLCRLSITGPVTTDCPSPPEIDILSTSDAMDSAPPLLTGLQITANGPEVTTTIGATDDLTGIHLISIIYRSTTTSQIQRCTIWPAGSPVTVSSASCTITFSPFAASGQWVLAVGVFDAAGNRLHYERRESDGFLCFHRGTPQEVCQDFGDTDLILP